MFTPVAQTSFPGIMPPMKYWEIIADNLGAAGWSWDFGRVEPLNSSDTVADE